MGMIDEIKRDREAGTPGPWGIKWRKDNSSIISMGSAASGPHKQMDMPFERFWGNDETDARRIARVPDMEAALLAGDELARELDTLHDAEFSGSLRRALDAYRAATEAST